MVNGKNTRSADTDSHTARRYGRGNRQYGRPDGPGRRGRLREGTLGRNRRIPDIGLRTCGLNFRADCIRR